MKEKLKNSSDSCNLISYSEDDKGKTTSVELQIIVDGNPYHLNIATPEYAQGLREYNSNFPPEQQLEDRFYILQDIPPKEELCSVVGKIPIEDLRPFLLEIPEKPPS